MQLDLICITDLTGSWLVVALTTFVGVLLYHTYRPKLQQKCQQLHCHEEMETANDSSSEEEVTTVMKLNHFLLPPHPLLSSQIHR